MPVNLEIKLPVLHDAQLQIVNSPARFKVVCCGRRFGKTLLAIDTCANSVLDGRDIGYFAPTYADLIKTVWKPLKRILEPVTTRVNEHYKFIETITGGTFYGFTLQDDRPGQGHHFHSAIIDEAASIYNLTELWNESIRATLADHRGNADFYSTPRGHDGFWQLYNKGLDPLLTSWQSFHFSSYDNPYMSPEELDEIKASTAERVWKQEYLAEFTSDGGSVFREVDQVSTVPLMKPYAGDFVFGVDWGRMDDYTAISVVDVRTQKQVEIMRFNQIGWEVQRNRLMRLYEKWWPFRILAENNSIGEVNIEALASEAWSEGHESFRINGFQTTALSKPPLIDELTVAIEKRYIELQDDEIQKAEFKGYMLKRLPSGRFQYSAPSGGYDDTVIATALSYRAMIESGHSRAWG